MFSTVKQEGMHQFARALGRSAVSDCAWGGGSFPPNSLLNEIQSIFRAPIHPPLPPAVTRLSLFWLFDWHKITVLVSPPSSRCIKCCENQNVNQKVKITNVIIAGTIARQAVYSQYFLFRSFKKYYFLPKIIPL